MRRSLFAFPVLGLATAAAHAQEVRYFRQIASYGVTGGIAEIVAASPDGRTLAFSDASGGRVGLVDITDPSRPVGLPDVATGGEPTSVSFAGRYVVAAVVTTPPRIGQPAPDPSLPANAGKLFVIDVGNPSAPAVRGSVPIGYQPDSVKVLQRDGRLVAVVCIENQPIVVDEQGRVLDEDLPGFPTSGPTFPQDRSLPGLIQVVTIDPANVPAATVASVPLPAASLPGLLYRDDPQPEFVDVHGNLAAVSLQENNGIAILDIGNPRSPSLVRVFSTGNAAERRADLSDDATILFAQGYPSSIGAAIPAPKDGGGRPLPGGPLQCDAVAFSQDGSVIYTADEGELSYTGGRGWSGFTPRGERVFSDAGAIEQIALSFGQYPDGRSDSRGAEIEGIATARFGTTDFAFVLSERGSFMVVYDVSNPRRPVPVQFLPTGISPEGVVAIPQRRLVVTADEVSGTLTIFAGQSRLPDAEGRPLLYSLHGPFGAISGLDATPFGAFALPDNALPTAIYHVRLGSGPFANLMPLVPVTKDSQPVRYDGEGIVRDRSILAPSHFFSGFFLASEGNGTTSPNLIVQTDLFARVLREIQMPANIDAGSDAQIGGRAVGAAGGGRIRGNGYEGLTLSPDGRYLLACIQRGFDGEPATHTRIARYDLEQIRSRRAPAIGMRYGGDWEFFYYPLEAATGAGFVGLSEILGTANGTYLVIERDQGVGGATRLKGVYAFRLDGVVADTDGKPGETTGSDSLRKRLVIDVQRSFFPFEKVEGLALLRGDLWVNLDNDGGEVANRFVNTGRFRDPFARD
jgi:hypothetical protein